MDGTDGSLYRVMLFFSFKIYDIISNDIVSVEQTLMCAVEIAVSAADCLGNRCQLSTMVMRVLVSRNLSLTLYLSLQQYRELMVKTYLELKVL